MNDIILRDDTELSQVDLLRLAKLYRNARGPLFQLFETLGQGSDFLARRLPAPLRDGLDQATYVALQGAFNVADGTGRFLPVTRSPKYHRTTTLAMGAVGGAGGFGGSLAEIPVTTTLLLQLIQAKARHHGIDPMNEEGRMACLEVLGDVAPFDPQGQFDYGLVSMRMAVTGATLSAILSRIAPRLSLLMGKKLALQSAPLLGAVAGAGINYAFTRYYEDVAEVRFSLMAMARTTGTPLQEVLREFEALT